MLKKEILRDYSKRTAFLQKRMMLNEGIAQNGGTDHKEGIIQKEKIVQKKDYTKEFSGSPFHL